MKWAYITQSANRISIKRGLRRPHLKVAPTRKGTASYINPAADVIEIRDERHSAAIPCGMLTLSLQNNAFLRPLVDLPYANRNHMLLARNQGHEPQIATRYSFVTPTSCSGHDYELQVFQRETRR